MKPWKVGGSRDAGVAGEVRWVPHFAVDDSSAASQLDVAAIPQHGLELVAAALHPGFHSGGRESEAFGRGPVGDALQLHQDDGLAVRVGKLIDHRAQTGRQLPAQLCWIGIAIRRLKSSGKSAGLYFCCAPRSNLSLSGGRAVVVDNGVAGDLVGPRYQAVGVFEGGQALVDAQEDLLQDVVDVGLVCPPAGR